jgi:hypothetical protein
MIIIAKDEKISETYLFSLRIHGLLKEVNIQMNKLQFNMLYSHTGTKTMSSKINEYFCLRYTVGMKFNLLVISAH